MTAEQAAAFVDSLTDEGLTKIVSELMWYQITKRSETVVPSSTDAIADVRRIMARNAREHLIARLVTP